MARITLSLIILQLLFGCASAGESDGGRRYTRVIESAAQVTRHVEPSKALQAFGLLGALIQHSANQGVKTNLHVVVTKYSDVSAQTDDEFAVGDCVEVIPTAKSTALRSFAYGDARIVRSNRCATELK